MKRGNDGEKIMRPMFPRFHVNDTEKGGPRAPPRNKMALYEQLSIPSQRFRHNVLTRNPSDNTASLVSPPSQGGRNERGMFFARQLQPIHPSQMQYSQHSELSTPLVQVEQRKKIDEDDYVVPVFIQPVPAAYDKYSNDVCPEKFSPSNPPYLHPALKFQKTKGTGMLEHSAGQEEGSKKGENSNESVAGQKKTVSTISHEPGTRLRTDDSGQQELCAETQLYNATQNTDAVGANAAEAAKTNSSDFEEASLLGDDNIICDLSDDTGSHEDESCRPPQTGSLERGDSLSESSILDTESALDITPDDVVGKLGQKHFWKARRAIMKMHSVNGEFYNVGCPVGQSSPALIDVGVLLTLHPGATFVVFFSSLINFHDFKRIFLTNIYPIFSQQRVFAVQLFELHRLVKVQKMIAALPNLLVEDSVIFDKPLKPILGKKRPLDSTMNAVSNASEEKGNSDNPSHKNERSAENTPEKPNSSYGPSANSPPSPPAITTNDHSNARTPVFNHPEGHQWLIPVMSPSEGLVYKPYPAPGFPGQGCGGLGPPMPNPATANFLAPIFGVPTPMPQYPFPPFPAYAPHGYFPYGMPMMSAISTLPVSSMEQVNPHSVPGHFSSLESASTMPTQAQGPVPDGLGRRAAEGFEVQGSSSSSPSERQPSTSKVNSSVGGTNILPILPKSSLAKPTPRVRAPRVIKVVPRNGVSASESAARIFRSIQEERMQYDSV
ncbi:protein EARLY FLOWERING 3-like [Salvia splendens]|uniref:protein EARLY FLOWERING 3-like n=1 Tax=Salvia splendens TaxID=180675 RepID=UPI001C25D099|nr:protein EARLY FLOWERING 3-like [Salvia splendens]